MPGLHSSPLAIAHWAELFHQFLRYRWPGNVRELANACRQVVAASDTGVALPEAIRSALDGRHRGGEEGTAGTVRRSMHEVDEEQFSRAWEQSRFEPAGTARLLGVSRQSVYRRISGSDRYRLAGQVAPGELRGALEACGMDGTRAALRLRVSPSALRAVLRNTDLEWR